MKLTGAAILVSRDVNVLQAAPAAYPYRSSVKVRDNQMLRSIPTYHLNAVFVTLLAFCNGCGYVTSGEWTDDKDNWTRAFGEKPPIGVTVVNSWYMRTPHFTAEYAWYFKLQLDDETRKQIETNSDCMKLSTEDATRAVAQTYSDRPEWFPMVELHRFDVYRSKSQGNFLMLLERDGSTSYWTSWQL